MSPLTGLPLEVLLPSDRAATDSEDSGLRVAWRGTQRPTPPPGALVFRAGSDGLVRQGRAVDVAGGTGKLDWLSRRLPRRFRFPYEVVITPGKRGGAEPWIFGLLERLRAVVDPGPQPEDLSVVQRTRTGLIVCRLESEAGHWGLKVATDPARVDTVRRAGRELGALSELELPGEVSSVLPRLVAAGAHGGFDYTLESWLPGEPGSALMFSPRRQAPLLDDATAWLGQFHRGTRAAPATTDWIDQARRVLARAGRDGGSPGEPPLSERIIDWLRRRLGSVEVPAVHGHGDLWLGNLLHDRRSTRLTGVVDWARADRAAPPLEDLLHLLLYRKGLFEQYDPGSRLERWLNGRLPRSDRDRIALYGDLVGVTRSALGPLVLLYWVRLLAHRRESCGSGDRVYRRAWAALTRTLDPDPGPPLDGLAERLGE